ncbi:MAG: hypothetical protein M3Y17_09580 [Actinomycetota bacterium]|nr:hypothetical protein [Actinomycetota bacterium]
MDAILSPPRRVERTSALKCRLYRAEEEVSGQPSEDSILVALRAGERRVDRDRGLWRLIAGMY